MESFIVRIYRRDGTEPEAVMGLVEQVGQDDKRAFHNLHELCGILAEPGIETAQETNAASDGVIGCTAPVKAAQG